MNDPVDPSSAPADVPTCYRHPAKETWIRCQRCERSICPDCMNEAAVGFQCPDCVARGRKEVRAPRTRFGGRPSANPQATIIGLIAANVAVWVAVLLTGAERSQLLRHLWLQPKGRCTTTEGGMWYPSVDAQDFCENLPQGQWLAGASDGAFWQVVTSGFAHVDIWHLALNCFGLWILGPAVEAVLGRTRFLALYLTSVVAGSTAVLWLAEPYSATLGASGGVFGLMGALLVIVWRVGGDTRALLTLLGINVVVTFVFPNISWQGHLGGLLGGALVALVMVFAPRSRRSLWHALGVGALALVLLALIVVRNGQLS